MNRAWIPAGALASVSVAGLIALGPLTDSLHTPVSFPSVVTVSAPPPKSSVPWRSASPAAVVGNARPHAALTRSGGAPKRQTNSDTGHVAAKISQNPPAAHAPASTPRRRARRPTPVKKKTNKRPTSIGGSTGSNGDEGLASGGSGSGTGGGGEQSATPGRPQLPETCRQPGSCWYDSGPWGYSSVGRAPGSHPGGQRFEPA